MINNELLDYIKKQTEQGKNKETIYKELLGNGGWTSADIEMAFNSINIEYKKNTIFYITWLLFVVSVVYIILSVFSLSCTFLGSDYSCGIPSIILFQITLFINLSPIVFFENFNNSGILLTLIAFFSWGTPISGIIIYFINRKKNINLKKYFLLIFTLAVVFNIVFLFRVNKVKQEENRHTDISYQAADVNFVKTKEQLSQPVVLGKIGIKNYSNEGNVPEIDTMERIIFYIEDEAFEGGGITFSFDNCRKDLVQDEVLKSYFTERKKVIIDLPEKLYKNRYIGGPSNTELFFNSKDPILVKDINKVPLQEFNNLPSRCSPNYYQVWLSLGYL